MNNLLTWCFSRWEFCIESWRQQWDCGDGQPRPKHKQFSVLYHTKTKPMDGQAICSFWVSNDTLHNWHSDIGLCCIRRVIEGRNVLKKLEQVETYNERPLKLCQVSNCGLVTVHENAPHQWHTLYLPFSLRYWPVVCIVVLLHFLCLNSYWSDLPSFSTASMQTLGFIVEE